MNRQYFFSTTTLAVLLILVAGTGTASAVTPDDSNAQDYLDKYLTELAVAEGKDPKVKIENNEKAMRVAELATGFEGDKSLSFVEAAWNEDKSQGEFIFCEPLQPVEQEKIAALPFAHEIFVNEGWCADELQESLESSLETLSSQREIDYATGSYDAKTGVLHLEYAAAHELDTARRALETALQSGPKFELSYIGSEYHSEDEYRGGDGIGGCTAGFVVRNGNTFGISTAGHCSLPTNLSYSDGQFTAGGILNKNYGDIRWHWSLSGTPEPSFRATTTGYMTATSVVSPIAGMGFCQYGMNSLTSCSTVYATNVCVTSTYGLVCKLAVGSTSGTGPGDSGGPVFAPGGYVIGIHKGTFTYGGGLKRVFSQVSMLEGGAYVYAYTA